MNNKMAKETKENKCIGVGMMGNVDSAKSTTIGALISGEKDDGNGKLRNLVARHPHERKLECTSDVAYHSAKFGDNFITFQDLAGHEKYLRTTIHGLTSFIPDLIVLCVDKYAPTYKMTQEHIKIAMTMDIPFVILITKIDTCVREVLNASVSQLKKLIIDETKNHQKGDGRIRKRTLFDVKSVANLDTVISHYASMSILPIFKISNTTYEGHALFREFLSRISKVDSEFKHPEQYLVDRDYRLKGVGLVVSGYNGSQESLKVGDKVLINNVHKGVIRSIHNDFRESVTELPTKTRGCIAIRTDVNRIRAGSVISKQEVKLTTKFSALVNIAKHATTIKNGYSALMHCGTVKMPIKVVNEVEVLLRSDTKGILILECQRPCYLEKDQKFFFREGRVIGYGKIIELLD